ncbi:hypothetical protein DUI87_10200 [Hirundo rustica rustica]|uniref:Uncharacterized protein n=1 Tax=Hirundo rustica rustica TaxID=333673 RepID=A0A3M0KHZ2_HIRRU|nr:hypothetical protein DUI87_10200 [Hirundo rustica rustica]
MDMNMKKFTVRRFFSVYLRKKSRSKSSSLSRLSLTGDDEFKSCLTYVWGLEPSRVLGNEFRINLEPGVPQHGQFERQALLWMIRVWVLPWFQHWHVGNGSEPMQALSNRENPTSVQFFLYLHVASN